MIEHQIIANAAPGHPCARGIHASMHIIDVRNWETPETEVQVA